jgi:hypothetical protein
LARRVAEFPLWLLPEATTTLSEHLSIFVTATNPQLVRSRIHRIRESTTPRPLEGGSNSKKKKIEALVNVLYLEEQIRII